VIYPPLKIVQSDPQQYFIQHTPPPTPWYSLQHNELPSMLQTMCILAQVSQAGVGWSSDPQDNDLVHLIIYPLPYFTRLKQYKCKGTMQFYSFSPSTMIWEASLSVNRPLISIRRSPIKMKAHLGTRSFTASPNHSLEHLIYSGSWSKVVNFHSRSKWSPLSEHLKSLPEHLSFVPPTFLIDKPSCPQNPSNMNQYSVK